MVTSQLGDLLRSFQGTTCAAYDTRELTRENIRKNPPPLISRNYGNVCTMCDNISTARFCNNFIPFTYHYYPLRHLQVRVNAPSDYYKYYTNYEILELELRSRPAQSDN